MTAPIRPGLPQVPTPAPQRSAAALAAQRAFFQSALERAAQPLPAAAATQQPAKVQPTATASVTAASTDPLPRPGRLLDIRV